MVAVINIINKAVPKLGCFNIKIIGIIAIKIGIMSVLFCFISDKSFVKKYEPIDDLTLWLNENKGIFNKENIMQFD